MKETDGAVWLVIKTRPRQEERARENLERQGLETYLPKIRVPKRRRGEWREVVEPLFPGYLFIHTDPHLVSLSPVRSTFGVSDIVRFGNKVVPVPADVISFLRHQQALNREGDVMDALPFIRGDRVDVLTGPFAGLSAIYQMADGRDRAILLVALLGRENRVTVPVDNIVPTV